MNKKAFIFGYEEQSAFVAKELERDGFRLYIVVDNKISYEKALKDDYKNVFHIDITDDDMIESLNIEGSDYLICMMRDNHLNVFLTLSLHELFPNTVIVAMSNSLHATRKLKMAGATKVIDTYQVSANRIHNIIQHPVSTKLIDSLLSTEDELSLREIKIPQESFLDKIMVEDFNFRLHKIILIGMIDRRLSDKFEFITRTEEKNRLDIGDTMVCLGYKGDLNNFEEYIRKRREERV